ncbi:Serine/threonine protein kinase [Phytophthora megakarya]|uniref:Serine/threonine protein kinase n=1 Tax=Phytophthora megakarya TaxID=4795 RepID=A0A225V007_9STRA|nr:Serine/threonine protein kinase [Phytophthora megakarya]
MSIYWTSGFNSEDTVNRSGSIPIEISGVVDLPRQVQYASGIHERLTAIYRSLSPNHSEADSGNWCEEFQTDRREQVNYYESAFDAGQSEMHLTDTTAATILSQIDFWLRRPSEITEEVKLMENIKATMSRTLKATNDVEISVKPNQPSKSPWKIEHSEIDVKFNDGGGVYRGEWQVAPVDIRKVNSSDEQSVEREAKIWAGLNHPHVAPLLGVVATEDGMLFITEPAEHGNLIKYRENHRNEIWQKLYEVGLALEYLHERGIIHGGLKPDNIRIGHDGRAKLTGFECSTTLSNLEQRNIALRGDSRWLAPELLSNSELSFASDVYSFAIQWRTTSPFGVDMSDADIGEKVKTGSLVPKCPNEFNEDQWNLVEKMYCFDANARTTLHEVVQQLKKFATEEKVAAAENIRNDPVVHLMPQ